MTDTLELRRKVCEALGGYSVLAWDTGEGVHYRLEYPDGEWGGIRSTPERAWQDAPALESDNGLALDAGIKRLHELNKGRSKPLYLHLSTFEDGTANAMFVEQDSGDVLNGDESTGETPAEAICFAICATVEKK